MKIDMAAEFPLPGFWSNRACAEAVYELDGQRYFLRQLDRHILYRVAERPGVEHTLFVPIATALKPSPSMPSPLYVGRAPSCRISKPVVGTPLEYPEAVFARQVRNGESGRLALYAHASARDCLAALWFLPNGTGQFLDYYTANGYSAHSAKDAISFVWGGLHGLASDADILTCNWQTLLPLCEEVFTHQVWPRMRDPFVTVADFPDVPRRFLCGSHEELEHITRCICHAEDGLFANLEQHDLLVEYCAVGEGQQGGLPRVLNYSGELGTNAKRLCSLAFAHNTFEGGSWQYDRYIEDTRRKSYLWEPAAFLVHVAPPSAHERAEALLMLYDWLEGRVSERERRHLLGMDAFTIQEQQEQQP